MTTIFGRELQLQSGNKKKEQNDPGWENHIIVQFKH